MAVPTTMFLLPPAKPSKKKNDTKDDDEYRVKATITKPVMGTIEPIGWEFLSVARRKRLGRTIIEDMQIQEALESTDDTDDTVDDEEVESAKLLKLDPLKWKEQDHYAVLGLSKKRWEATEDEIKKAYRRKVLKHHPDKKQGQGDKKYSDSFFKCIQKAWEVLCDPEKRKQWDSVDPTIDEALPSKNSKGDFFDVYSVVFHSTSRFSVIQPVPKLGDLTSTKEEVEEFYTFWHTFQSWRSFEALDEEDVESASCREEKRWIERTNRAARVKRKKEDTQRINRLVDQAFQLDPRIQKFKDDEKKAKEAKKRAKEEAKQKEIDDAKAKEAEIERQNELAALEVKARRESEKKEKELAKRAIKKEKKKIKGLLKPLFDTDELATQMKLDVLFDFYSVLGDYEKFSKELEESTDLEATLTNVIARTKSGAAEEEARKAAEVESRLEAERQAALAKEKEKQVTWSPKEVAALIKAVKMFPGGAGKRWLRISEYIEAHGGEENETSGEREARFKSEAECIKQAKVVQQLSVASDREKLQNVGMKNPNEIWDKNMQTKLEDSLRKHKKEYFDKPGDRRDAIAKELDVDVKVVKERVKELQEQIKKKKAAASASKK